MNKNLFNWPYRPDSMLKYLVSFLVKIVHIHLLVQLGFIHLGPVLLCVHNVNSLQSPHSVRLIVSRSFALLFDFFLETEIFNIQYCQGQLCSLFWLSFLGLLLWFWILTTDPDPWGCWIRIQNIYIRSRRTIRWWQPKRTLTRMITTRKRIL